MALRCKPHSANTGMRGEERKEGPLNKERGDGMGDGSLQSQFGENLHPKRAKNRINVAKGGEVNGVALTASLDRRCVTCLNVRHPVCLIDPILCPLQMQILPKLALERTITYTIPSLLARRPFLPFLSSHSCVFTMRFASMRTLVPCRAGPLCAYLFLALLHQLLRSFRVRACRAESPELYSQ
jgi:hypothetical protein